MALCGLTFYFMWCTWLEDRCLLVLMFSVCLRECFVYMYVCTSCSLWPSDLELESHGWAVVWTLLSLWKTARAAHSSATFALNHVSLETESNVVKAVHKPKASLELLIFFPLHKGQIGETYRSAANCLTGLFCFVLFFNKNPVWWPQLESWVLSGDSSTSFKRWLESSWWGD